MSNENYLNILGHSELSDNDIFKLINHLKYPEQFEYPNYRNLNDDILTIFQNLISKKSVSDSLNEIICTMPDEDFLFEQIVKINKVFKLIRQSEAKQLISEILTDIDQCQLEAYNNKEYVKELIKQIG